MKSRLIPLITMLIAGLIAWVMCFIYRRSVTDMMVIILIVLIVFFIIGLIAEKIFENLLVIKEDNEDILNLDEDEDMEDVENFDVDSSDEDNMFEN